jgi:hypothetical protein
VEDGHRELVATICGLFRVLDAYQALKQRELLPHVERLLGTDLAREAREQDARQRGMVAALVNECDAGVDGDAHRVAVAVRGDLDRDERLLGALADR